MRDLAVHVDYISSDRPRLLRSTSFFAVQILSFFHNRIRYVFAMTLYCKMQTSAGWRQAYFSLQKGPEPHTEKVAGEITACRCIRISGAS